MAHQINKQSLSARKPRLGLRVMRICKLRKWRMMSSHLNELSLLCRLLVEAIIFKWNNDSCTAIIYKQHQIHKLIQY